MALDQLRGSRVVGGLSGCSLARRLCFASGSRRLCFGRVGALPGSLFSAFTFSIYFFELCVKYDVSTLIDYSFRTFDVIFIVWPLLYVWPLSTYDV